jgi:hypothetical protein
MARYYSDTIANKDLRLQHLKFDRSEAVDRITADERI